MEPQGSETETGVSRGDEDHRESDGRLRRPHKTP